MMTPVTVCYRRGPSEGASPPDSANRTKSTTSGSSTISYLYDGDGKRLQETAGSTVTKLLWDASYGLPQLALERTSSNALLRRYVYGSDLVSMTTSAGAFFEHEDGLGSVQNVTNASGVKQWTYVYEPFGLKRTETKNSSKAPVNPMQFTGEYLDAAPVLYHLRARQYDPIVGRFTAIDPLPPLTSRPYISSYAYVDHRPTALIDPSGLGADSVDTAEAPVGCGQGGITNEIRCIGAFFADGNVTVSTCWGVCFGGALDG